MAEIGLRLARFGSDPGVRKGQTADSAIVRAVQENCGGGIAQSPQHDAGQLRLLRQQRIDRCTYIVADVFERARLAFAVSHTTIVEAQDGISGLGQRTCHQNKLPVTADTILGTANHYEDAEWRPLHSTAMKNTHELRVAAAKHDRFLAGWQGSHRSTCPASKTATAARIMAGTRTISVEVQNGSPA